MRSAKIITIIFVVLMLCILYFWYLTNSNKKSEDDVFKNPVRIVFISDNNYVSPMRASIKSIIANKKPETQVEINVISVNITKKNLKKIEKEKKKNIHLNIIEIDDRILDFDDSASLNPYVSRADTAKFFLAGILHNIDKVIYLDGDTIILKDLSDLYNTNLGDNYAGVSDDWQTHYSANDKKERYFNCGVLLLNLKKIRQDNVQSKLIEYKRNDKIKRFVTQDAFNSMFYGKTVFIPLIYDTFAPEYEDDYVLKRIKEVLGPNYNPELYFYKTKKEFQDAVAIIHYCGYDNIKPWWELDFNKKSNRIWYKYATIESWTDLLRFKKRNSFLQKS